MVVASFASLQPILGGPYLCTCLQQQTPQSTLITVHVGTVCLSTTGESQAGTRLVFPLSLTDVYGNSSSYTYGPGFIQFNGASWTDSRAFLANVTKVNGLHCLHQQKQYHSRLCQSANRIVPVRTLSLLLSIMGQPTNPTACWAVACTSQPWHMLVTSCPQDLLTFLAAVSILLAMLPAI